MKKILILLLLLVNLQITDNGTLCMGIGGISAQTMWEETLDGVIITGSAYVDCDWCYGKVLRTQLELHKDMFCPERPITCPTCSVTYKEYQGHNCNGARCIFCNQPADLCICSGPVISGNGGSGGSGSGSGVGQTGGGSVGDTTTESSDNSEETNSKEDADCINSQAKSVLESLKTYTDKIKQIIENLSSNNRMKFHDGTRTYYNPSDKCLYIGNSPTEDMILHEIVHSIQDDLCKLSYESNSSNNEFETAWVTHTVYFLKNMSWGTFCATDASNSNMTSLGITQEISDSLELDLYELVEWDKNGIIVNDDLYTKLESFLTNENLENFKAYWKKVNVGDEYWHSTDYNYEYIIKSYLNKLGY